MYRSQSRFALPLSIVSLAVGLCGNAAAAEPAGARDAELEELVIVASGSIRQQQSISTEQLQMLPAGTSPLKAIEKLPGVNFQSADPYGAYEWSTRIVVRGFNQNQMGFTLDGVPLGDMSYGNHNGLHISRAIASENVARVTLSQGAGALATASSSNLGGTIEFVSRDPSETTGGQVDLTAGSNDSQRLYGRLDLGGFNASGTRLSIAGVRGTTSKWKGAGDQEQRIANFKLVQPLGERALLTAYYSHSDRAEIDYQDMSFDILRRRGDGWDNYAPNWSAAVAAANGCAASGFSNAVVCDDAYWNASGLRKDKLGYLSLSLPLGAPATLKVTGYLHQNEGQGLWGTPYVPTPGGAPLSVRTTEYDIDRKGLIANLGWNLGAHELAASLWTEQNDFNQARRFYPEATVSVPTQDFTRFLRGPMLTQWEYAFDTKTLQISLQDTWQVTDALRLNGGFKSMNVENSARTIVGPNKTGAIEVDEGFLPQLGFSWALNQRSELFGLYARNARAFVSANTAGPFSTTDVGFAAIRNVLKPETSSTIELGWRFRNERLQALVTAYQVDFSDRLLAIQQGPGIVGNPSVLANVGSVTTQGVEAALNLRLTGAVSWFTSLAFNDSQYDDNFTNNGVLVAVAGKQVVDAPKQLLRSEIVYEHDRFFARADINHVGKRYYTYLNQGEVEAYTLLNATAGYRFGNLGPADDVTLQLSITNLADRDYIATIGSNGFTNSDPTGTAQTLLPGAPRQIFMGLKARF